MGSQFDHSPRKWDMFCDSGSHVTNDRGLGRLWNLEVSRAITFRRMLNGHQPLKKAEYLDFFYNFVRRLLVCMAWHSRTVAMARRRRFVYP